MTMTSTGIGQSTARGLAWAALLCGLFAGAPARAQVSEDRTPTGGAGMTTRKCVGGSNAGAECTSDAACDSGDCFDYNIVDLTFNFRQAAAGGAFNGWTPTAAQMAQFQLEIQEASDALYDSTDGQMLIGTVALVVNNAAPNAAIQVTAGTCVANPASLCVTNADCPAGDRCNAGGGLTNTGGWGLDGKMFLGPGCVNNELCFVHELLHLVANVRDEYEGGLDAVDNNGDGQIDECNEAQSNFRCFDATVFNTATDVGVDCEARDAAGNPTNGPNAAACPAGTTCRRYTCQDNGPPGDPTIAPGSIMQCCLNNTQVEMCTDANHDPNVDTEHHRCRGDSTWTRFALEWSRSIVAPAGLPVAGPVAAPVPVTFLQPDSLQRFVAVLDRSDSMNAESPRRIDTAINATNDFIDLLTLGVELGVVSFASADGGDPNGVDATKEFPAGAGLQSIAAEADRTAAKASVSALTSRAAGFTRIGEGLRQARQALLDNGGTIGLGSSVLLLTDGINNRPEGSAAADLDAALTQLAADNLSVFVSCIGDARNSTQCSDIADRTSGRFVDSVTTPNIMDAFVEFVAQAENSGISSSSMDTPIAAGESTDVFAQVEVGADAARFVVSWRDPSSDLDLVIVSPSGVSVPISSKIEGSQSEFYRVSNPEPGTWRLNVTGVSTAAGEAFSLRTLVDNSGLRADAKLGKSSIQWPENFQLATTVSGTTGIKGCTASGVVDRPDGSRLPIVLRDDGSSGDGQAGDGSYGVDFSEFAGDGIYTFTVSVGCLQGIASLSGDSEPNIGPFADASVVPTIERVFRFSGTVRGVPSNLPPTARICNDVRSECTAEITPVQLSGACSTDPEGQALSYVWFSATGTFDDPTAEVATGRFPIGYHGVSLSVADSEGLMSLVPDQGVVVIVDTTPPQIEQPEDVVLAVCDPATEPVVLEAPAASDICSVPVVVGEVVARNGVPLSPPVPVSSFVDIGFGTFTVVWTATDSVGLTASVTQTVELLPAVYATNGIEINDRARVLTGAGDASGMANTGAARVVLGVESHIDGLLSVGAVELRDRARADGLITSAGSVTLGNQVQLAFTPQAFTPITLPPPLSLGAVPPAGTQDVTLQPNQVLSLAPGSYRTVSVASRSTLRLTAGDYSTLDFLLEPQSVVELDQSAGPIRVVASRRLQHRGRFDVVAGPSEFTLGYLGTAETVLESTLSDTLLFVPNARVVFGAGAALAFSGQVYARSIRLRPDVSFTCESGL